MNPWYRIRNALMGPVQHRERRRMLHRYTKYDTVKHGHYRSRGRIYRAHRRRGRH